MQYPDRKTTQRFGEAAVLRSNNPISITHVILVIVAAVAIVGCTTGVYTLVYSQPHAEQLLNHTLSINSLFSLVQAASQLVLNDTSVIPGTYVHTTLAVDQKGRLTLAANGTDYGANVTLINSRVDTIASDVQQLISNAVTGTVEQIDTGTGLIGGPINSTGTISLSNTPVTPGTYSYASLTVDAQGRLTSAASGTSPITSLVAGTGLSGGTITGSGTVALTDTTVATGSYTHASITVDAQGRLTAASDGINYGPAIGMIQTDITGIVMTIADLNMTINDTQNINTSIAILLLDVDMLKATNATVREINTGAGLIGGPIMTTGTVSIADTAVTPGSYTNTALTVDQQGRITAASSGTAPVTSITAGTGLTGGTISGGSGTIGLAASGVSANTYGDANNVPQLSIDSTGRVTSATTIPIAGIGAGPVPVFASYSQNQFSTGYITSGLNSGASVQVDRITSGKMVFFMARFFVNVQFPGGSWDAQWPAAPGEPSTFLLNVNHFFLGIGAADNTSTDINFLQTTAGAIIFAGAAPPTGYNGGISWFNVLP